MPARSIPSHVKAIQFGVSAVVLLAAAICAYLYWDYQQRNPSTDDAYVQANIVGIAAQVSGPILRSYIRDNQFIAQGTLMFEIDPRPFELAVQEARAKRDKAMQDLQADEAAVQAAQAEITNREAVRLNAQQYYDRIAPLIKDKYIPADKLDTAVEQLHSAEALLRKARHDLETAENLKVAAGTAARVAEAALATADLNLTYTRIIAPADGFITNLNLPPGNYVRAGEQLFALVDSHSFWLSAIYRETHLTRIRPGQPAIIRLYLYPERIFHGVVQGIGWGIHQEDGATVSLLPDVSPVIYWVRLAQRFPVRVEFTDLEPSTPLRMGARGTATIYTEQVKDDGSK